MGEEVDKLAEALAHAILNGEDGEDILLDYLRPKRGKGPTKDEVRIRLDCRDPQLWVLVEDHASFITRSDFKSMDVAIDQLVKWRMEYRRSDEYMAEIVPLNLDKSRVQYPPVCLKVTRRER